MDTLTAPEPREVRETFVVYWEATHIKPRLCVCGHFHYGRVPVKNGVRLNYAPQFHLCEDSNCECHSLKWVKD